ncbi:hypothetical protein N9M78_04330 [Alphaproteobacteria bacterium]|nr:hypothetical protein [Alphaproteobacteria bacterium]
MTKAGIPATIIIEIAAGASYFAETGNDIQPNGEMAASAADAIFLGAISLPEIRHKEGTEISPHLRLRDRYQLLCRYTTSQSLSKCANATCRPTRQQN